jgi:autotransporter-associated beta strand protein
MIYAAAGDGVTDLGAPHTYSGSFSINLGTGGAAIVDTPNKINKMNIHGVLMAVAWVLLLPLGSLIARHR